MVERGGKYEVVCSEQIMCNMMSLSVCDFRWLKVARGAQLVHFARVPPRLAAQTNYRY